MNKQIKVTSTFLILLAQISVACFANHELDSGQVGKMKKWKLGWRIINSSWQKNYELGEQQFDSLLTMGGHIETKFLLTGLSILSELGKQEKIISLLNNQDEQTLQEICNKPLFTQKLIDIGVCASRRTEEVVENKTLQLELIKMFVNDQAARGSVQRDLIQKYRLEEFEMTTLDMASVDGMNCDRLKEIIAQFGFPTKNLVGKDAMQGVFLIIQHANGDKQWQKEQLVNIKEAVNREDVDGQAYAYLYDRIKVNEGLKQLYGTQFENVDAVTQTAELAATEDVENLDQRRMEVGLMPIAMYKQIMLRGIPK